MHPHLLCVGSTGSGKTYAIKSITGHILAAPAYAGCQLYLADEKGIDYKFLSGTRRYFTADGYAQGLGAFHARLVARIHGRDTTKDHCLLVLDEWNNHLSTLEKKNADSLIKMLSYCLNMGRAYHMHIICGAQTAHADWFGKSRDSYGAVLGMGQLSKECIGMVFHGHGDQIRPQPRGCGYLLQDGLPLQEVIIPRVRDSKKLERVLSDAADMPPS